MSYNSRKYVKLGLAAVIFTLLVLFVSTVAMAYGGNFFTAEISPGEVCGLDIPHDLTVTVENDYNFLNQLDIYINTEWFAFVETFPPVVTDSSGKNWSAAFTGLLPTLEVIPGSPSDRLDQGESLSVTFKGLATEYGKAFLNIGAYYEPTGVLVGRDYSLQVSPVPPAARGFSFSGGFDGFIGGTAINLDDARFELEQWLQKMLEEE